MVQDIKGMKNELTNLLVALVGLTIFLAVLLLVGACQDDHVTNVHLPADSLDAIVVCDTLCTRVDTVFVEVPGDSVFCYIRKQDGEYKEECQNERREG